MDENREKNTQNNDTQNIEDRARDAAGTPGDASDKNRLRNRILNIVSIGLVLFAAVILFRQYVYIPGEYEAPPSPTPVPEVTPEPTPYVKKIPTEMHFRGRNCPVEPVGSVPYTDSKGREIKTQAGETQYIMDTVDSKDVAAWLENSMSPGEYGNAIFAGHITWKKVAGIFNVLPKMEKGEEIIIGFEDGSTKSFTVSEVIICGLDEVPDYVMKYDTGDSRITLITCYGESWNSDLGTRNGRCIVIAHPTDGEIIPTPDTPAAPLGEPENQIMILR